MSFKKLHRITIGILLFVLSFFSAQAMEYYTINTSDGLPSSNIWSLHQDSLGFIWMGTANGLVRYDGSEIKTFTTEDGLLGNSVVSVSESAEGNILTSAYRLGITEFHSTRQIPPIRTKTFPSEIQTIEHKGNYYTAKYGNSVSVEHDTSQSLEIIADGNMKNACNYLIVHNDTIFCAKTSGLFTIQKNQIIPYVLPDGNRFESGLYSLSKANKNRLVCAGSNEIYVIDSLRRVQKFDLKYERNKSINSIVLDNEGTFWIALDGEGLYKYNTNIPEAERKLEKVNDIHVNDILLDRNGNVWVATYGQGIFVYKKKGLKTYKFREDFSFKNAHNLWFDHANNRIFLAGMDGLGYIEKNKVKELPFVKNDRGIHGIYLLSGTKDGTLLVCQTGANRVWASNKGDFSILSQNGINIFTSNATSQNKSQKNLFIDRHADKESIGDTVIFNVYEKGKYGYKKLYEFHKEVTSFSTRIIKIITENEYTYASTGNVVFRVNEKLSQSISIDSLIQKSKSSCYHYEMDEEQIGEIYMTYEFEDSLIIGTDKGVYKVYFCEDSVKMLIDLESISYSDIEIVSQEKILVGTKNGLLIVDQGQRFYFGEKQGLLGREILDMELDTINNDLWLVTYAGLTQLNLNILDSALNANSKDLSILSISGADRVYSSNDSVRLKHRDNSIQIEFCSIDFASKDINEFEYALVRNEGALEWLPQKGNLLNISDLSPGKYALKVRLSGSKNYIEKSFEILYPWWRTTLFYILASLLLLLSLFLFGKAREARLIKKKQAELNLERRINDLEQQALGAMMNPHFIFNSLNSVQFYINKNQGELANNYLAKVSNLIRLNLELAGEKNITLSQEVERLELYLELEKLRLGEKLNYEFDIQDEIDLEEQLIPSMIIQPIVENSIWHGITPKDGNGLVEISISIENNRLKIRIKDDGVGLQQAKRAGWKSSKGKKLTEERLNLFAKSYNSYSSFEMTNVSEVNSNGTTGVITNLDLPDVSS